jgi:hypothetical protein
MPQGSDGAKWNIMYYLLENFLYMGQSYSGEDVAHEPLVSSPELKAQLSLSDHLLSVVYLSVFKLFTF